MINESNYRNRKVDAEDLKPGDMFYDRKDGCFYKVKEIQKIKLNEFDFDIGIVTKERNKRKNQILRKSRLTKVTVQEFRN